MAGIAPSERMRRAPPLPAAVRGLALTVNGAAVKALEKYDLQKFLRANWAGVAPKIDGTVHVYAAEFDNFYLEGACRKLEAAVKELGPAIDVHIVPGMRHEVSRTPWQVMFQILRDRAAGTSNLRSIDQR